MKTRTLETLGILLLASSMLQARAASSFQQKAELFNRTAAKMGIIFDKPRGADAVSTINDTRLPLIYSFFEYRYAEKFTVQYAVHADPSADLTSEFKALVAEVFWEYKNLPAVKSSFKPQRSGTDSELDAYRPDPNGGGTLIMGLHKNGVGNAYIIEYFDRKKNVEDLIPRWLRSLRFAPSGNKKRNWRQRQ